MNHQGPVLEVIEAVTQPLLLLVMITGLVVARIRINSSRPREGWLVGIAIGLFAIRLLVLALFAAAVSFFIPNLWELAQTNRHYSRINWWFGLIIGFIHSSFYAASWCLIFYAAFGPGSSSTPRYLVDENRGPDRAS